MTITYPANKLPRPLADGYGLVATPATLRTDMDNGTPRMRRRFTRTLTTATLSFHFTREKFGLFDGWWRAVLLDGTSWFQIALRNGVSDALWTVRGIAPPEASLMGTDVWHVTWRVEVDQVPQLDAGAVAALIAEPDLDLAMEAASLYQFVNVDYPSLSSKLGP